MAFEYQEGQGSLFRVDRKTNERAPDYKGKIKIGGHVYELAGWLKKGQSGTFLSLKASEPRERGYQRREGQGYAPEDNFE